MHQWWIYVLWEVELARAMQDPSSFTLCLPWVSWSPVPPKAVVMYSPLRLNITPSAGVTSPHPSPLQVARPRCPVIPLIESSIRGMASYPIQWLRLQWMGPPESLSWGLEYSGPSLPLWLSLSSPNLLSRDDFLWSVRSRRGLASNKKI